MHEKKPPFMARKDSKLRKKRGTRSDQKTHQKITLTLITLSTNICKTHDWKAMFREMLISHAVKKFLQLNSQQ
jgi:hypothetical protein